MRTEETQAQFEALFEAHRGIAFKVAATYCREAEDRRDLAQEIGVQLWKAFPGYDPARSFSTWMYRIALNVAISYARSAVVRARHAAPLDPELEPADEGAVPAEPDDRVAALHRAIAGLGDLDRALMVLYLDARSQRDIAEVLGISESNVATKINRLKQRIRRDLETGTRPTGGTHGTR